MKIIYILFILKIFFIKSILNKNHCNFMHSHTRIGYCISCSDNDLKWAELEIKYFSHFTQFDLSCYENDSLLLTSLEFYPNRKLILDSRLRFSTKIKYISGLSFKYVDLSGFDSDSSVFSTFKSEIIMLDIFFSQLRLFKNSILYTECKDSNSIQGPLKNVNSLAFAFSVKYFLNTCPLIFKNSQIDSLKFYGFSEIFIKNNMLGFNLDQSFENLNSNINIILVHLYKAKLRKNFLNKYVFQNTKKLVLNEILNDIEPDSFDQVSHLNLILSILNFDSLIQINIFDRFPKNQSFSLTLQLSNTYLYPNEDICLFRNISSNLNICILPPRTGLKCTCSILWILKYNTSSNNNNCNSLIKLFCSNLNFNSCNFSSRFEKCNLTLLKSNFTGRLYLPRIDRFYLSVFYDFISTLFIPLFSIIGIFTNFICIFVLKMNESDQKSMRKLMLSNSIINFLICFIYLIHLINKCAIVTGIFCSNINRTFLSQAYFIYLVKFFGSILKLGSNLTSFGISLVRLNELDNKRSYLKFSKRTKVIFAILFTIFSMCLNIHIIFSNKISYQVLGFDEYSYSEFPVENIFNNNLENFDFVSDNENLRSYFIGMFEANFIINDVIFLILISALDIAIIFKLKKSS